MNSGIRSIENYAVALHRYDTTKHIRGRDEDQRPLGDRKKINSFRMSKRGNGDIQCILYNTPVVTFTVADNIVINLNQWVSGSTCKFLDEVTGGRFSARLFDGSVVIRTNGGGNYRLHSHVPSTLTRTKDPEGGHGMDTFTLSDWEKRTVHMVDRAGKKAALEQYRAATEYLNAFVKLRAGDDIRQENVGSQPRTVHTEVAGMLRLLPFSSSRLAFKTNTARIHEFATSTSENKHQDFYVLAMLLCEGTLYNGKMYLDMVRYENLLIGINRDKVFKEVEVADGLVKKDAYKGFFGSIWNDYHKSQQP
jgi:hypothetical protein